ncbi:MAG: YjdF family protein [Aristaeellaceae bacterium]
MEQTGCCLTVWFEEPFWVGMFQRTDGGRLSVAKVVFGAEPKDYEVYAFVLRHYDSLIFSPAVEACVKTMPRSPKRQLRDVKKQLEHHGTGTRSQQALKMQQEQGKAERKAHHRLQKEAEEQRRFAMKQRKRKDKHRGH